jgi:short subunit dehydrogenase-like uncharacterized protein
MHALLYGATGYTGQLIARLAAARGLSLVLAARDGRRLGRLATELGGDQRTFGLEDPDEVRNGIGDASVVLNCAGPFIHTWRPLTAACIDRGAHYIDITGEIDVFEGIAAAGPTAAAAGVMLLPGAGFDVVASDCLAVHLAARLPGATRLLLAIRGSGPMSRGTASTVIESQDRGGVIRRGGALIRVPAAWRTRSIDFGDGRPRPAVTIPWGDVATAYHSTGIGDIEVYAAAPPRLLRALRLSRRLRWLLRRRAVKSLQRRLLKSRPAGPSQEELAGGMSRVWGRVEDAAGHSAESVLLGPNGYLLTAHTALLILQRALAGGAVPGFHTPAEAYGADLILEVPGTERRTVH